MAPPPVALDAATVDAAVDALVDAAVLALVDAAVDAAVLAAVDAAVLAAVDAATSVEELATSVVLAVASLEDVAPPTPEFPPAPALVPK